MAGLVGVGGIWEVEIEASLGVEDDALDTLLFLEYVSSFVANPPGLVTSEGAGDPFDPSFRLPFLLLLNVLVRRVGPDDLRFRLVDVDPCASFWSTVGDPAFRAF